MDNPQKNTVNSQDLNQAFGNPFNVAFHVHNGADAPQVPFSNLAGYQFYIASQKITVPYTQIITLNSTPVILVPRPILGAIGNMRLLTVVMGIGAYINYGGMAYTGANNLEFRYSDGSGVKVTADMSSTFLNSSANGYNYAPAVTSAFIPVNNAPIVVSVPTSNPATGNSSITFVIHYRLISF